MLGIKPKSPLNDSYTSPPATHVSNAAAINNAVNQITAAIRAKSAKTDKEKDQAREDKLMNKQIRNRRKLNRLEGKVDNVGDKRKERIKGRIEDAKTKGTQAKTEWHESRKREYDTKGNHCPYGIDAKGNCKPKPTIETKSKEKSFNALESVGVKPSKFE